jgi:hypothetical protein
MFAQWVAHHHSTNLLSTHILTPNFRIHLFFLELTPVVQQSLHIIINSSKAIRIQPDIRFFPSYINLDETKNLF